MELEDVLFQWAATQPTVTQFIGGPPGTVRLYKLKQPQGTKTPSMTVTREGRGAQELYCGEDGALRVDLRIDHYAKDWATMAALAKAWKRALKPDPSPYPMYMGGGDSPGELVRVKSVALVNEFDLDDPEPGICRRSQLWTFWIFSGT